MKAGSSILRAAFLGGAIYTVTLMLFSSNAQAQDLFDADEGSGNIYEFTPGGVQSTFASGLGGPIGLAFDSAGNLFVSDTDFFFEDTIYKFTPGGVRSTFAQGLGDVGALAFDSAGDLFVGNSERISKYTPNGASSVFATGVDGASLAFNSAGDLFTTAGDTIYEFTPGGARSTFATVAGLFVPGIANSHGLAFNSAGDLFVSSDQGNVIEFAPDGTAIPYPAGGGMGVISLAFDSAGDLFGSAYPNPLSEPDSIDELTPGGVLSTFASGVSPFGLAFAPSSTSSVPEAATMWPIGLALFAGGLMRGRRKA